MKIYRFFFSNLGWYRIRSKYKLSLFQYILRMRVEMKHGSGNEKKLSENFRALAASY